MGGDYGGADCVHVIDVRALRTGGFVGHWTATDVPAVKLRDDTDVIVHDEHGNVCQYTYQEWRDHVAKILRGEYAQIGLDATLDQRRYPDDRVHGAHAWEYGNDRTGRTNYRCDGWDGKPFQLKVRDSAKGFAGLLGIETGEDHGHQEHEINGTCIRCGEQWPCVGFAMPSDPFDQPTCNCSGTVHPIATGACVLTDWSDA
jgi:hypothetical protein